MPTLDRIIVVPADQAITRAVETCSVLVGREVDVSVLADGFTNDVFLVRADDERYVFRVPGQASDLLEISRADERYNAEMAAAAGASPRVVDYLEDMDVMVLEFIDGHVPTVDDLQTPERVRTIAEAVRILHGGPRFNNDADMYDRGKRWFEACNEVPIRMPDGIDRRMAEIDAVARALAAHPLPTVPCHNDLAPYNLIDDGNRLWIIDFEFSGNNDPCSDLGMIASEARLDEDLRTILCEAYFGDVTPLLLARLKLYAVLSDFWQSLYCAIQAETLSDESFWDGATTFWKAVVEALDSDEMPNMLRAVADG